MTWRIVGADCIEAMAAMDEASVDAVVTDPPYDLTSGKRGGSGLASVNLDSPYGRARISTGNGAGGFMGQAWDGTGVGFDPATWRAALRVLKPGGHLLAFGGTRTYHRLVCAVEDAGFEIRDCLAWMYGSGFPKSLDVSKAIDKAAGAAREIVGRREDGAGNGSVVGLGSPRSMDSEYEVTAPATDAARTWQGWGTALKPAFEPIILARKPLSEPNVAANVTRWGTGALNIDGTRIPMSDEDAEQIGDVLDGNVDGSLGRKGNAEPHPAGRWPANVVLDEEAAALLDEQTGERPGSPKEWRRAERTEYGAVTVAPRTPGETFEGYGDTGGASRFFYVAKAGREERDRGLEHRARVPGGMEGRHDGSLEGGIVMARNPHPTVKPVELMRWLCRLVTPPGGVVLDPFTGSGSTGIAALREGFSFIGIEREAEYVEIARDRIIGDAPLLNVPAEAAP